MDAEVDRDCTIDGGVETAPGMTTHLTFFWLDSDFWFDLFGGVTMDSETGKDLSIDGGVNTELGLMARCWCFLLRFSLFRLKARLLDFGVLVMAADLGGVERFSLTFGEFVIEEDKKSGGAKGNAKLGARTGTDSNSCVGGPATEPELQSELNLSIKQTYVKWKSYDTWDI